MSTLPTPRPRPEAGTPRTFYEDVVSGLLARQKTLPCKYFYDAVGSELFERICDLPEYYLTRTERAIMMTHAPAMADALGEECVLIEYGSGSSVKTEVLLGALCAPHAYVPIDISYDALQSAAERIRSEYPSLHVLPVWADYTRDVELPLSVRHRRGRSVYFPGSTIGNFHPPSALAFLQGVADVAGPGGALLIGVDLRKDPHVLERAYNDAAGVTEAFNKRVLARINEELGADFNLDQFKHVGVYNPHAGRIEMHLLSLCDQRVRIAERETILFTAGETIRTEVSYKYTLDGFAGLAWGAGFTVEHVWTDPDQWFSVQLLRVRF